MIRAGTLPAADGDTLDTLMDSALRDAIFALGPHIRYVAFASQTVELSQREGLSDASASSSDFFEELLVNPTLLTLASQRGQSRLRRPPLRDRQLRQLQPGRGRTSEGLASVCVDLAADPVAVAEQVAALVHRA